ncbi:variant erythrocyte surface antigen-1 family protein [Babesia divergens]|uniref:Variant erythrocyte surface antigen-1 family protein n=1 Tax=Babesia divergens TaxID=32595 RepID=A0AAD9G7A2_BABDI|nr:variant erythrocyte surface antigen-1 family protein [Babesia divergens]
MFFIPSSCPGCRILVCLSVLRTFGSVLTGTSGLPNLTLVSVLYCSHILLVSVISLNLLHLHDSVEALLPDAEINNELQALASGLESFIGYGGSGKLTGKGIGRKASKDFKDLSESEIKRLTELVENADQEAKGVKDPVLSGLLKTLEAGLGSIISKNEGTKKGAEELKEKVERLKSKLKPKGSPACNACAVLKSYLNILQSQYVSSYSSSASWDSLCSHSSGSSQCPSNGCCDACPKRLCARIFLGFIPALYFGLKIVFERCKDDSDFPGWNQKKIPEAPRLKDFLKAWGYDVDKELNVDKKASEIPELLESLFNDSSGILKSLYDASLSYFSKNYFVPPSPVPSSDSDPSPSTVRSMLFWLYGLRFTSGFSSLVLHCSSLCSPFGNSFHPDAFCYYLHVSCFLLPVSVISVIQCPDGSDSFLPSHSYWKDFCYPENPSDLLDKLCEYVRKIYIPLNFLRFQCERTPAQAGWQSCYFGQKCAEKFKISSGPVLSSSPCSCSSSDPSNPTQGYLCTAINKDTVHDHCLKDDCRGFPGSSSPTSVSCSDPNSVHPQSNGKPCTPCPHPLMRFLIDDSSDSDSKSQDPQNFRTPFHSSTVTPMGFSGKLSSPGKKGLDLGHVLAVFCKDGFYPLARLCEFALYVSRRPPDTLGELFIFFMKFAGALNSKTDPLKTEFSNYASKEPGRPSGDSLKNALEYFVGSEKHHWEDKSKNSHKTSPTSSFADLYSLIHCSGPKGSGIPPTCGEYLHPLIHNVDGVFTPELCDMYLSFFCHLGPKFYSEFKDFHTAASTKFSCCLSSSGSPCPKIVECPCALPFIYSWGFTFFSPSNLNGTNKKSCKDFLDQLGKFLGLGSNGSSPYFKNLLRVIDEFIWHIRLPFIYAFLYIWILVISYFYYVQFYKLDLLHVNSHLHLPRSFKILPSTLFSDSSSNLKDLSYFTL